MIIYPKEDIKNAYDQILWYSNKPYECLPVLGENEVMDGYWAVTCENISPVPSFPTLFIKIKSTLYPCVMNRPILATQEVNNKFYTIEDRRSENISEILK